MKDKEKQIEEIANIPTKEEIEARNKRGKEKDELRQALLHYATAEASGGIKSLIDCEGCAFYLYEMLGYRKLPKDSIVISKEEYEELKQAKTLLGFREETIKMLENANIRYHETLADVFNRWVETDKETGGFNLHYIYDLAHFYEIEIKE